MQQRLLILSKRLNFTRLFIPFLLVFLLPIVGLTNAQDTPPDAIVSLTGSRLRLHDTPALASPAPVYLDGATPLRIIGRTTDGEWLEIRAADGNHGWVVSEYITLFISLDDVPVTTDLAALDRGYALPEDVVEQVREIFQHGQELGNHPDVFSKVGDSISVSNNYLHPIGRGVYNLGDFQFLQGVIDYFSQTPARDGLNSFDVNSVATGTGWSTDAALSPYYADPSQCNAGESPLTCEYRLMRPSVALIMFGTNDTSHLQPPAYERHLREVVDVSIEYGVIPVLSTIPMRTNYEEKVNQFNAVVEKVASDYHIPLWDFNGATIGLPDYGLDTDGVHPSIPANGFKGSADFRSWNLYAGYVMRNLTALQVLHLVYKVIQPAH